MVQGVLGGLVVGVELFKAVWESFHYCLMQLK